MKTIDLVACAGLQLVIELTKQLMLDFMRCAATTADQVMVGVTGCFVNQLPIADVRRQDQSLQSEKIQGAVDGRLGQAWQILAGALVNFERREMSVGFIERLQNCPALRRHSAALGVQVGCIGVVHLLVSSCYCE